LLRRRQQRLAAEFADPSAERTRHRDADGRSECLSGAERDTDRDRFGKYANLPRHDERDLRLQRSIRHERRERSAIPVCRDPLRRCAEALAG
jgi:hypothetical protein